MSALKRRKVEKKGTRCLHCACWKKCQPRLKRSWPLLTVQKPNQTHKSRWRAPV
uniref:Uncharacterized protein n=1 Tax=Anguilla anguilla TaxID=7936 RepID=A0A0E9TJW0_ANGAN